MADFFVQFGSRLAVMLPAVLLTVALAWFLFRKTGVIKSGAPFSAGDMRTWPFSFALIDAAIFTVIFAAISASMTESATSSAVAGGAAALFGVAIVPGLAARILK